MEGEFVPWLTLWFDPQRCEAHELVSWYLICCGQEDIRLIFDLCLTISHTLRQSWNIVLVRKYRNQLWSCDAAASPISSAENKLHVTFQTQHSSESKFARTFDKFLWKWLFECINHRRDLDFKVSSLQKCSDQEERSGRQKPSSTSRTSRTWRLARSTESQCM